MKYQSHRAEPYFTFLKNGQKTIEGRLKKGKYSRIKKGDFITVYNQKETDKVKVVVKKVTLYRSIKEMLSAEPIEKILPDVTNITQGIKVYRKFYTPKQEQKFGMVAIEVERKL